MKELAIKTSKVVIILALIYKGLQLLEKAIDKYDNISLDFKNQKIDCSNK